MNEVILKLNADEYRLLINVMADLPNRSNTYGLLFSLEQQFKSQLDPQNAPANDVMIQPDDVIEANVE